MRSAAYVLLRVCGRNTDQFNINHVSFLVDTRLPRVTQYTLGKVARPRIIFDLDLAPLYGLVSRVELCELADGLRVGNVAGQYSTVLILIENEC